MSRGPSGRIVVEIEPQLKRQLYARLARNGMTLKQWMIGNAQNYVAGEKTAFRLVAEAKRPAYRIRNTS